MTDPELGPAAWSIPSKTGVDLGFNGWNAFLGDEIKVMVADVDHLSMPVPPDVGHLFPIKITSTRPQLNLSQVTKLHKCMEEALEYFNPGER